MSHRKKALVAVAATAALALGGVGLAEATTSATPPRTVTSVALSPQQRVEALRTAAAQASGLAVSLGLNGPERLVAKDVMVDSDGTRHVRYDRTYAGLPVIGGDLVVHSQDGRIVAGDWAYAGAVSIASTTPKRTAAQANSAAPGQARHARKARATGSDLVVYAAGGAPVLAYKSIVDGTDADGNLSREAVVTDAQTGALVASFEVLHEVTGTGNTLLDGQVSLDTTLSGSTYQMIDPVRGNTKIYDSHGTPDSNPSSGATLYTDSDNVWGNGAKTDRATAGADVNYGLARTWDYYNPGTNVIVNGGFESGTTGWTGTTVVITNNTLNSPHSGTRYAWLLGNGSTATEYIAQTVTIPTSGTKTLRYYLAITTRETGSVAYDKVQVQVNGITLQTWSNVNAGGGYLQRSLDLSAYAGQSVTIRFYGTEDASLATDFLLDDITLA